MNINIEDFSLTNFISSVETMPFDYAGVGGIADCFGYYIICFKERNSDIASAISFDDILLHKELTEIANHILQNLYDNELLSEREAQLLSIAMSKESLSEAEQCSDQLRSNMMKKLIDNLKYR